MQALEKLLHPEVIWAVIPIVAILAVFSYKGVVRYFDHKERLEKIKAGIDPDAEQG